MRCFGCGVGGVAKEDVGVCDVFLDKDSFVLLFCVGSDGCVCFLLNMLCGVSGGVLEMVIVSAVSGGVLVIMIVSVVFVMLLVWGLLLFVVMLLLLKVVLVVVVDVLFESFVFTLIRLHFFNFSILFSTFFSTTAALSKPLPLSRAFDICNLLNGLLPPHILSYCSTSNV